MRYRVAIAFLSPFLAAASSPAQPANAWRLMADQDIAFIRSAVARHDIYAAIGDRTFQALFDRATADAVAAAPSVHDVKAYTAVLKRYLGTLQDPHASVRFAVAPTGYQWPRFLVRHFGTRYVVVGSQDRRIPDGAAIDACDGRPLDRIADAVAPDEQKVVGLEASRDALAPLMLIDAGNPFYTRPRTCTIAGNPVALDWTTISANDLAARNAAHASYRDPGIRSRPIGSDGLWIRLGSFGADRAQAAQYKQLFADLPRERDRRFIVVDVCGNGGGSYNWFMQFLRSLYGDDYTAYHARARLKIRSMFIDDAPSEPAEASAAPIVAEPPDPPLNAAEAHFVRQRLPNGRWVKLLPPVPEGREPTDPSPLNPVQARVYVLTDGNCASACIGFLDEILRFANVEQIGSDTATDRLSGTPATFPLPSGNGEIHLPSMIRFGRERGDNIPRRPTFRYDGDISDTSAVEMWLLQDVIPRHPDRGRNASPDADRHRTDG